VVKDLYKSRWHVELDLRFIKTTLGMETLSCNTPEMAIKEFWVYLLAYNLIRLLPAAAWLFGSALPCRHTPPEVTPDTGLLSRYGRTPSPRPVVPAWHTDFRRDKLTASCLDAQPLCR
jgi:hypothetical protein